MSRYTAVTARNDTEALEKGLDTDQPIGGIKILEKTPIKSTGHYTYTLELFERFGADLEQQTWDAP